MSGASTVRFCCSRRQRLKYIQVYIQAEEVLHHGRTAATLKSTEACAGTPEYILLPPLKDAKTESCVVGLRTDASVFYF